jgi:hypothetical protein
MRPTNISWCYGQTRPVCDSKAHHHEPTGQIWPKRRSRATEGIINLPISGPGGLVRPVQPSKQIYLFVHRVALVFPFIFPNMYDLLQARFATHLLVF